MRWPLELLFDDSGSFAPKRTKPTYCKGSPVATKTAANTDFSSLELVRVFDDFLIFCPMCDSAELVFSRSKKRSVRLRDANPPPKTPA